MREGKTQSRQFSEKAGYAGIQDFIKGNDAKWSNTLKEEKKEKYPREAIER